MAINIIIIDDDYIIREGLKMIISSQEDMKCLALGQNGQEAVRLCQRLQPDITLIDIRMPIMDGIKASEIILNEKTSVPLLLTTFDEEEFVLQALKLGISGYILKNSPAERIISSIRTVYNGGTVFQADILSFIRQRLESYGKSHIFELLSNREMEIVKLISKGLSNQEIADELFISNGTVRNYISTILDKTGLSHRTQIAVKYLENK